MFEPVGRPRLAFGNIISQARFEREEPAAIGLGPRFDAQIRAPLGIGVCKTLLEQFSFGQLVVKTDTLQLSFEFGSLLGSVVVVEHIPQTSHLEHHVGQVGDQIIAPTQPELFGKVVGPVGTLQLHRVGEHGPNVVFQRADTPFDRIGHVIEVFANRLFVHVVEDRAGGSRGAVDYAGKRLDTYQGIKDKLAFWDIDRNHLVVNLVREIDRLIDPAHRVGNQL